MTAQSSTALPGTAERSEAPAQKTKDIKKGNGWRIGGALLFPMGAGLGFAAVYIANRWTRAIPIELLLLVIPIGIGLSAGIGSRFLLRGRSSLLQLTVGFAGVCLTALFLGWLSTGIVGTMVLPWEEKQPQWDGLLQLFLGFLGVLLVLPAWRRRKRKIAPMPPEAAPEATGAAIIAAPAADSRQIGLKIVLPEARPIRRPSRPAARKTIKKVKPKKKRRKSADAEISIAGEAVDRCPYCLETVDTSKHDEFVICEICKTPHHSDCWAVTGSCQVAHFQE